MTDQIKQTISTDLSTNEIHIKFSRPCVDCGRPINWLTRLSCEDYSDGRLEWVRRGYAAIEAQTHCLTCDALQLEAAK